MLGTRESRPIGCNKQFQKSSCIKVRVMSKSQVKYYTKPNQGREKLFSVVLSDGKSEIRATAFQKQVNQFYDILQEDQLFYISNFKVEVAYKNYTTLENYKQIHLTCFTSITPCNEDDPAIPMLQFCFVPLDSICDVNPDTLIDVIGVCKSVGEVVTLTARTSNEKLKKRDVTLVDRSLTAVTLTLWGTQAEEFVADTHQVVAVKRGKVNEFCGEKSISLLDLSRLCIDPDLPKARELKDWFHKLSENVTYNNTSNWKELGVGRNMHLLSEAGSLGCGDSFSAYCTITHIRTDVYSYKACPTPSCNKKVVEQDTGTYRCEKCNRDFDNCKHCYRLSVKISDFSGHHWITLFQDTAEKLLGVKADDLVCWQRENNSRFGEVFKKITFLKFMFDLKVKRTIFNDVSRLDFTTVSVHKPDYKRRCYQLISEINEMSNLTTAH